VGKGGPRTFSRGTAPLDRGNQNTISIEAGNNGVGEPWPKVQQDQYVRLVRALCDGYGFKASDVFSHYEWTPGRKIDPAGPSRFGVINMNDTWNMDLFRKEVAGASPGPVPGTPPSKPPTTGATYTVNGYRLTVKQGSSGKMAKMCQQQINLISGPGIAEDGNFGSQSVGALKNLQAVLKVPADGVCGPQTWQAMETGIKNQADKGEWD
jgi:peptidoglycan hydrolase-like protein with peptidoglycan-binding domain